MRRKNNSLALRLISIVLFKDFVFHGYTLNLSILRGVSFYCLIAKYLPGASREVTGVQSGETTVYDQKDNSVVHNVTASTKYLSYF
jgi:hypothetical protein